jgi:hypothetical protein
MNIKTRIKKRNDFGKTYKMNGNIRIDTNHDDESLIGKQLKARDVFYNKNVFIKNTNKKIDYVVFQKNLAIVLPDNIDSETIDFLKSINVDTLIIETEEQFNIQEIFKYDYTSFEELNKLKLYLTTKYV